jgi:hypothetical protein
MKRRSIAVLAGSAMALYAAAGTCARAELVCYPLIPATMVSTVTSSSGYSGQVFQFKTTAKISSNGFEFPAGSIGYGVVLSAVPASNRARNGIVVLEPRFLLVDGQQVQITGDPADASVLTHGPSPIGLGAGAIPVPGLGFAVNEAVNGTNITIGPGYTFHVVPIGNLQERGPCLQSGG